MRLRRRCRDLVVVLALSLVPAAAGADRLLVLHSAHPGDVATDAAMNGIAEVFARTEVPPGYWVEYLDAERFRGSRHERRFARMLALKYARQRFDAVVTTGNAAFEFAYGHREELFPDTPIVFASLSGYGMAALSRRTNITGVLEGDGFQATLDAAFALHPGSDRLVFVTPGLRNRHLVEPLVATYRPDVTLEFVVDDHWEAVRARLGALAPGTVVMVLAAPAVAPGDTPLALDHFVARVAPLTPAPIYAVWDYLLGEGIVGGLLVSGATQARAAARMALDIAAGRAPGDIGIVAESPEHFSFDHRALERFGVERARLPAGSVVVNEPPGLFAQHRALVLATALVVTVLLVFVVTLSLAIMRRKRAEALLRDSEEKYRQIFATESDAIIMFDAEGQQILDVNEAALRLYGYGRAELLRMKSTDLSAEPLRSRAFITRVRDRKFGKESRRRHLARDGREIPVELTMSAFSLKGRAVIVAVVRDVSDRVHIEEELRRSERRFRDFAASASDWYWEMDAELRFSFFSERFGEVTGLAPDVLLGRRLEDVGAAGSGEREWREHLATLHAHKPFRSFVRSRTRADGMVVYIAVNGRPVFDAAGNFRGYRGTGADITESKRAEEELNRHRYHLEELVTARTAALEAANRELESFSYSVSHDLRSPLRAMDGFSHALLHDYGDRLDDRGREYAQRVRAASQRMGQLIDGLLELSRLTRRRLRADCVDLSHLADEVARTLDEAESGRTVEMVVQPGLSCTGDRRLLRVVLENLLGNAWKYTAQNPQPRIEFGCRHDDEGSNVFYVRDNGIGFDMAYVHKLFGEFQRLHAHGEYSGTGIGLATVARIIRRHGGEVWAEGVPDEGATFSFTVGASVARLQEQLTA